MSEKKIRAASPEVIAYAEAHRVDLAAVEGSGEGGRITLEDAKAARPMPYVTPLVAKLAVDHNVDLRDIEGTGAGGRIRRDDVLAAAGVPTAAASPSAQIDASIRAILDSGSRLGLGRSAASARPSIAGKGPAFALNPLVAKVHAKAAAAHRPSPSGAAPSLFAAGDLPPFTASGIPTEALLQVPWQARHAMAAAPTAADAYAILAECSGSDAEDTAAMLYGAHQGNADYADRVANWEVAAMTDAQLEASLGIVPHTREELERREAALPLDVSEADAAMINDLARRHLGS